MHASCHNCSHFLEHCIPLSVGGSTNSSPPRDSCMKTSVAVDVWLTWRNSRALFTGARFGIFPFAVCGSLLSWQTFSFLGFGFRPSARCFLLLRRCRVRCSWFAFSTFLFHCLQFKWRSSYQRRFLRSSVPCTSSSCTLEIGESFRVWQEQLMEHMCSRNLHPRTG